MVLQANIRYRYRYRYDILSFVNGTVYQYRYPPYTLHYTGIYTGKDLNFYVNLANMISTDTVMVTSIGSISLTLIESITVISTFGILFVRNSKFCDGCLERYRFYYPLTRAKSQYVVRPLQLWC